RSPAGHPPPAASASRRLRRSPARALGPSSCRGTELVPWRRARAGPGTTSAAKHELDGEARPRQRSTSSGGTPPPPPHIRARRRELVPSCRARSVHRTSSAPRYELTPRGRARRRPAPNGAGLRDAVRRSSLDGYGGGRGRELLLGLVGLLLSDTLEDGLGGAVGEVLGLLEAERRERTHLLDDLDLLVADGLEDDVELRLLLGGLLGGAG